MYPEPRLPRHRVERVAGIGIDREGGDLQPGIAAALISALPIVIDIADAAKAAQPDRVAVVLADDEPRPGSRNNRAAGQQRLRVVEPGAPAAAECPGAPAEVEQVE